MEYVVGTFVLLGFNFTFWLIIGSARFIDDRFVRKDPAKYVAGSRRRKKTKPFIGPREVAVIVPAYNEELTIAGTIESLMPLLPPAVFRKNVFVNTYGSSDRTAEIAARYGVNVLNEPTDGRAKAEKLHNTVGLLRRKKRFKAALFVDADTRIGPDFLERALPYFDDPKIVAFAGYATTMWDRGRIPLRNRFFVAYRERMYFFMQTVVKYAQTWRSVNVSPIVPGFASIYRMSVLPKIEIDAKGLVIEDFNMTFEVHHKRLGSIAHHPSACATTQDPDNFRDYVRQVGRWNLGFWQTVKRHGFWPSLFSVSLLFYIVDTLLGSVVFLLLPPVFLVGFAPVPFPALLDVGWFARVHGLLVTYVDVGRLFLSVFLIDYAMTVVVAYKQERWAYYLFGFGFLFLRLVDSYLYVTSLPKAFSTRSSGRWKSPTRRDMVPTTSNKSPMS